MQKTRFFSIALLAAAAAAAGPAFALGDVTNNGGAGGTAIANPVATGGNAAATGGTGIGIGVGTGGNATAGVIGSGNSSAGAAVVGSGNSNNTNTQGQQQGQNQGQIATGGAGGAGGAGGQGGAGGSASAGASSNSGGNTMVGGSQATTNNNGSAANVTVQGDTVVYEAQKRAPVNTAYAAPLTASNGTCMGSTSAGAQGVSFGISLGSTWTDSSCDLRYDAEALRAAGLPGAAQARLCQKTEIAEAMKAAGTPCPGTKVAAVTPAAVKTSSAAADTAAPAQQYTDPIIRARLGLPPLKN